MKTTRRSGQAWRGNERALRGEDGVDSGRVAYFLGAPGPPTRHDQHHGGGNYAYRVESMTLKGEQMDQKKKDGWIGLAAVAFIAAIGLSTCGESDGEKKAKEAAFAALPFDQKVQSLSKEITEVREVAKGESIMVTFFMPSIWDGRNWMYNFLVTAKNVLSKINTLDPSMQYQQVVFMVRYPTRDSLGNSGDTLGMKVFYKMSDFNGAKWDNMYESDIANLASDVQFKREGLDMAAEYCKESAGPPEVFCRRVVNAMVGRLSR